jgi:hypothetical protein
MTTWQDTFARPDSDIWLELIIDASYTDDLADRLTYIRNAGSVLIENDQYGYIIKPVIGHDAWESQAQYDKEKRCLVPYQKQIIMLLRILRRKMDVRKRNTVL